VSIAVTPTNPSIALGTPVQFTAIGTFSDNTAQDLTTSVTWSSSTVSVAAISNAADSNGKATPISTGQTTIKATSGNVSGSTTLTVTQATLVSIAVTPTNPSIALGTTQQFTATGTFSDNTTQDLTTSVTWSSSSVSVAAISNAAGSNGKATPVATGSTTITATLPVSQPIPGLISGSTTLTVTPATLVSITVTPINPRIVLGTPRQFTAIGTFSDNTTQDLTTAVTWSSSATSVAAISNAAGSNGKATSVAVGTATIAATSGSISGSTTLTVIVQPTRMDITIALNPPVTSLGALQFSLISDPGATYNNDAAAINAAVGQTVLAIPVGNSLNVGLISGTSFNTLATPIIRLSYAITAGTLPGVLVSPTGIVANDGASQPITPPLTPANFVVTVNYI
jgi:nicotinamide mononucleotide (NMN) deamidase PncC